MGEEVKITECDVNGDGDDRVLEWEDGLPSFDDLTPLSQPLIPPELASAFRICPEPSKTMLDVNRASDNTFSSLQQQLHILSNFDDQRDLTRDGSQSSKTRRIDPDTTTGNEDADDSAAAAAAGDDNTNNNNNNNSGNKALKRPRLVWTPQLHKRFVDVVAHLGIKNAVPKTIMQLMNVEGLTRENVASHLQKYRLYLKRMQGLSNEGPSSSDHLFASTPVPHSLQESGCGNGNNGHNNNNTTTSSNGGHMPMPMPMMYPPQMMPMPMMGMSGHGVHMPSAGFHHHQYNMGAQQRDWSGNKFAPYHHVAPNEK